MDTSVAEVGVETLHDELLRGFQETGMYDYAQQLDIIQGGEIPEVKMHEQVHWTDDLQLGGVESNMDEEELQEGEARVATVEQAAAAALEAAENVRRRQRALHDAGFEDEHHSTPVKSRKNSRRSSSRAGGHGGELGGRNSSKGLRHFSMKVCEKVEGKGRTTYNEVADELVNDLPGQHDAGSPGAGGMQYDEKNIRRRVYDALNVLMAMDIITREKKEIFWKGLPQGPQLSLDRLRAERHRLCQKLDQQRAYIGELARQQAAYRTLMRRNRDRSADQLMAGGGGAQLTALPLPFVLIQVHSNATVEIQISEDNRQAHFDFEGSPFKFMGDEEVLLEMGLHSEDGALAAANPLRITSTPRPVSGLSMPTSAGMMSGGGPNGIPGGSLRQEVPPGPLSSDGGLNLLGNVAAGLNSDWKGPKLEDGSERPSRMQHHRSLADRRHPVILPSSTGNGRIGHPLLHHNRALGHMGSSPISQLSHPSTGPTPYGGANPMGQPGSIGMMRPGFNPAGHPNASNGAANMDMSPQLLPRMVPTTQGQQPLSPGWGPYAGIVRPANPLHPTGGLPSPGLMPPPQNAMGRQNMSPHQGMLPMSQGMMPNQGMMPMSQGAVPMTQGMMPMSQGSMPMSQGSAPMSQRSVPMSQGMAPMSPGMMPMNQGMMPRGMPTPQQQPQNQVQGSSTLQVPLQYL